MAKRPIKVIEFLHRHGSYNAGETAGFSPDEANKLIKMKVAKVPGAPDDGKEVEADFDSNTSGGGSGSVLDNVSLEDMTKNQLIVFARDNGISVEGIANMKKTDIIEAIQDAISNPEEDGDDEGEDEDDN